MARMKPERWRQIEDLYHEASALDEGRRAEFLSQACKGDEELRRELESLLAHGQNAARFIETPAMGIAARLISSESLRDATSAEILRVSETLPAGSNIGPYHLLQLIGEGGMGEVWLAEQREPVRRRVALKLIKARHGYVRGRRALPVRTPGAGADGSPRHRQGLRRRLDGRGPAISRHGICPRAANHDYCDKHKLTLRQRLELFIQVCEGVQHAHQKAIIHRDLKPSNILVTEVDGRPMPRIIDFGVAKAISQQLTQETVFTRLGSIIGTLGYMSPEQAGASGRGHRHP